MLEVPASLLEEPPIARPATSRLGTVLKESEQQMIEHALSETAGRVSGGLGAASRLGVPASTLESKIRRYNIDKHRFRMSRS
jgi:formate hydrogenlyase transcriptional activator